MKNVEDYAAINETVEAAKFQPDGLGIAKLVNALLRRCQREIGDVRVELSTKRYLYNYLILLIYLVSGLKVLVLKEQLNWLNGIICLLKQFCE